jgi:hypothetical protein
MSPSSGSLVIVSVSDLTLQAAEHGGLTAAQQHRRRQRARGDARQRDRAFLAPATTDLNTSKPAGASDVLPVPVSAVRCGITSMITLSVPGTMCGVASSWKPTLTGDSSPSSSASNRPPAWPCSTRAWA